MNKKSLIIIVAVLIFIGAFLGYRQSNLNKLHETQNEVVNSTDGPVCVDDYDPVCGVDNKTHSNECVATKIDNVQIQYKGQCKDIETVEDVNMINNSSSGADNGEMTSVDLSETNSGLVSSNSGSTYSGTISASGILDGVKLLNYDNSNFNYGFSLPYNTFFAGYGSQGGSSHSVGINTGSGITSFDESVVKVFFYKGKILSELENTIDGGQFVDKDNGRIYMKLGNNSIIIESLNGNDKIVDTIINTIYAK